MAFKDDLNNNFSELKSEAKAYIDSSLDYYQLWAFKVSAKAAGVVLKIFLLSLLSLLALIFLSFSAAYAIGAALNSISLGFLVVGGSYIMLCIIIFLLRKFILDSVVIRKISDIFFN